VLPPGRLFGMSAITRVLSKPRLDGIGSITLEPLL
jgi:hypothetical protein